MLPVPRKVAVRLISLRFSSTKVLSTSFIPPRFSSPPSRTRRRGRACYLSRIPYGSMSLVKDNQVQTDNKIPSKRRQFKDVPVHPSILSYIQTIGVGIPNRRDVKKRKGQGHDVVLNKQHPLQQRRGRQPGRSSPKQQQSSDKSNSITATTTPPLPFGPKARPVKIISSVGQLQPQDQQYYGFPVNHYRIPEVALVGRSNVGKSTLLNALLYGNRGGQQAMMEQKKPRGRTPPAVKLPKGIKAATSDRPGETKQITFYQLEAKQPEKGQTTSAATTATAATNSQKQSLWLVDLPGYGFAYASQEVHDRIQQLVQTYLLQRGKNLKRILLLLDARHGMKKADVEFLQGLEQEFYGQSKKDQPKKSFPPIQLVLTKCDLVDQIDLARRVFQTRQHFSETLRREPSQLPIMLVSARAGVGFNKIVDNRAQGGVLELQKELAGLAIIKKPNSPSTKKPKKDDLHGIR